MFASVPSCPPQNVLLSLQPSHSQAEMYQGTILWNFKSSSDRPFPVPPANQQSNLHRDYTRRSSEELRRRLDKISICEQKLLC
eukprot:768236-Hanusia_phi.AAC.5